MWCFVINAGSKPYLRVSRQPKTNLKISSSTWQYHANFLQYQYFAGYHSTNFKHLQTLLWNHCFAFIRYVRRSDGKCITGWGNGKNKPDALTGTKSNQLRESGATCWYICVYMGAYICQYPMSMWNMDKSPTVTLSITAVFCDIWEICGIKLGCGAGNWIGPAWQPWRYRNTPPCSSTSLVHYGTGEPDQGSVSVDVNSDTLLSMNQGIKDMCWFIVFHSCVC